MIENISPQPAIDHCDAVSNFLDDDFCETCFSMLCSGSLEHTAETVLNSDSQLTQIYGRRCKHFNVRVYLTQLNTKLHIICYMY